MKPEEVAAYIGSAAWIPQIASWIYHSYITPRVIIIPNNTVEIGFTRYGPIFNLNMAFSSDRRDAIINEIKVVLTHEDGDQHILRWAGMRETFSEVTDNIGNRQVVAKDQTPIAFKIGTEVLLEKYIRFQEPQFQERTRKYLNGLADNFNFLKENDTEFVTKALQTKEFKDTIKIHQESFWWKTGKYRAEFNMESPRKLILEKKPFYFILNQTDIDELKQNITQIEKDFTQTIKSYLPDYKIEDLSWNWRYPFFVPES